MDYVEQIKNRLSKMTEAEKDVWMLSQVQLLSESRQKEVLLALTGVSKVVGMPTYEEIDQFCKKVEDGEIYVDYETHYYEFDSEGRYMDDWEAQYDDRFGAFSFLSKVFEGCHDLLRMGEYEDVSTILDKVCDLKLAIEETEESEDGPGAEFITLSEADTEGLLSMRLSEVGEDWIRAVVQLTKEQDDRERAERLLHMFEHPICGELKPRILKEDGVSEEIFRYMADILEKEIAELESRMGRKTQDMAWRETCALRSLLDRKQEILLDICIKCLKKDMHTMQQGESQLAACWKQILQKIQWLSFERYIDDQLELGEIHDICEMLIKEDIGREDWEVRKRVLADIIQNGYYGKYGCDDLMEQLAEKLCANQTEYLFYANMLDKYGFYWEKAARLYHQYGRDDKYVAHLESHLNRECKVYIQLITYYQEHYQLEDARRVIQQGLEKCQDDLTEIFIYALQDALRNNDQERYNKLYASAKRRKRVNVQKVIRALEEFELEKREDRP